MRRIWPATLVMSFGGFLETGVSHRAVDVSNDGKLQCLMFWFIVGVRIAVKLPKILISKTYFSGPDSVSFSPLNLCCLRAAMQMARAHCFLVSRCLLGGKFLKDCLENVEVSSFQSAYFSWASAMCLALSGCLRTQRTRTRGLPSGEPYIQGKGK